MIHKYLLSKLFKITLALSFIIFLEYSFSVLKAQEANNLEFAEIYIYRFKAKSEDVFTLFFNRKEVLKMASGGRLLYRLRSEGSITVTAIAGTSYQEPSSRDKNYRSFTVEKGKSYYLEISGSKTAEITYVLSQISGKRNFEDDKKFVGDVIKQEENINDPIPSLSIEKNIVKFKEMVNKAKVEIAQKEKEIKKKINDYFEDLKKRAKLAREVSPNVNVNVEEDGMYGGRMRYNLRATYSYEVDEGGVKAELAHYPSGKYQLPTSPAALATTQAMKETIEYYLAEYFEPGGIVNVRVTGSADAIPIRNPYFYLGEYNEIADQDYYLASSYETISKGVQIDSAKVGKKDGAAEAKSSAPAFIENSPKKAISLKKGDKITQNEQLAFLRTMGIRYFVENDIAPLQRTKNQFIHRGKVEGSGSKYRKVIIELAIQDIFRNK